MNQIPQDFRFVFPAELLPAANRPAPPAPAPQAPAPAPAPQAVRPILPVASQSALLEDLVLFQSRVNVPDSTVVIYSGCRLQRAVCNIPANTYIETIYHHRQSSFAFCAMGRGSHESLVLSFTPDRLNASNGSVRQTFTFEQRQAPPAPAPAPAPPAAAPVTTTAPPSFDEMQIEIVKEIPDDN